MLPFRNLLMLLFRNILCAGVLLDSASLPGAEEGAEKTEAVAGSVLRDALPEEMATIFPVGRTFTGVAIPSYEGDRLQSVMRARTITRVDERHLDLADLVITLLSGGEDGETTVFMEEAVYDLALGILTSKTPARIEQKQFTMTGETMTFDTRAQASRLVGTVKVIIPDASALAPTMGFPVPTATTQ